jgi:hypothetical protein
MKDDITTITKAVKIDPEITLRDYFDFCESVMLKAKEEV